MLLACEQNNNTTVAPDWGESHEEHAALTLPKRLAFMTGHVEAGLALYRAGEPEMAARHLLHPVSETHATERVGLAALGFDAELFVAVSTALENDVPAADIEPQLLAAQANLKDVAAKAGGDPIEIIGFLMDTVLEEYAIGVSGGKVTDPGEYQDAFGFTQVALLHAAGMNTASGPALVAALDELRACWPAAPVPPENPASFALIGEKVGRVRQLLADLPPYS